MKRINLLLFITSLLILSSCAKELPYPAVDAPDVLVMNGLISPEKEARIHLSQSCHITDLNCEQKNIENAEVFLKDENGNNLVELIHESQGLYAAVDFTIEHNKVYKIEAEHADFESIQSEGKIPKSFNCNLIGNEEGILQNYLCRTFEIEIEDNPNEVNYYLIDGWVDILNDEHQYGSVHEVNGYIMPHTGFISNDINVENNTMLSNLDYAVYPLEYIFLKDENFNGETYSLEFGLFEEDITLYKGFELEAHIHVRSVSKEVYDYFHSVTIYKLTHANFLAEPQQIFSNIENGIGLFGGLSQHEFIVDLPQTQYYLPEGFDIENEGCTSPCSVHFSADMGESTNFNWSFGDGNYSTEKSPSHQYQSPGVYTVQLNLSIGSTNYGMSQDIEIL